MLEGEESFDTGGKWERLYQPKKRTFDPRGKVARSFRKTRVVGVGPLVLIFWNRRIEGASLR